MLGLHWLALALGSLDCQDARRTEDGDPRRRRAGVHRDGATRRLDPHRRRAGRRRVVGDRAQRDGGARAGGLPRPAPHVGGPDPDRQGLPVLRRPSRRARPARRRDERRGRRVLLGRPRPARGDVAAHEQPARPPHQLRGGGRRTQGRGRDHPQHPTRRSVEPTRDGGGGPRQRNGREPGRRATRRDDRRDGRCGVDPSRPLARRFDDGVGRRRPER